MFISYIKIINSSCSFNDSGEMITMKKMMQIALLIGFIVLTTATFTFAQFSAAPGESFPFFHFGCLIIGGLIIVSLKRKYDKLYLSEAIGSFALYTTLIAIFTAPVVDTLKNLFS